MCSLSISVLLRQIARQGGGIISHALNFAHSVRQTFTVTLLLRAFRAESTIEVMGTVTAATSALYQRLTRLPTWFLRARSRPEF